MSVATVMTAVIVSIVGYRVGRAHAAWRDVRSTKRDLPAKRRIAWARTRPLFFGALFLVIAFAAVAYDAGH